ncbi:hypothetical protein AGR6A_Cc60457 [Agrobacterium sp. NCPPB 925]|nr:hypothetical protein AGR6A_Cc60457 [Agrobacterium sp. NCPPB 925]
MLARPCNFREANLQAGRGVAAQPVAGRFQLQAVEEAGACLLVEIKIEARQQIFILQGVFHQQQHPRLVLAGQRREFRRDRFAVGKRGCLLHGETRDVIIAIVDKVAPTAFQDAVLPRKKFDRNVPVPRVFNRRLWESFKKRLHFSLNCGEAPNQCRFEPIANTLFFYRPMRGANGSLSKMPSFSRFLHLRLPPDFNKCLRQRAGLEDPPESE